VLGLAHDQLRQPAAELHGAISRLR
jgi:hypothetical protein